MRLSPLDIRKHDFTRTFRGFDEGEVTGFLETLSRQWEEVVEDLRRSQDRIREMEGKLEHYQKVEEALQEALTTTRENSRLTQENAERKAEVIVREAETKARDVLQEAQANRRSLLDEVNRLQGKHDEIVSRLRAFLVSEMEVLARFEKPEGESKPVADGDDRSGTAGERPASVDLPRDAGEATGESAEEVGASHRGGAPLEPSADVGEDQAERSPAAEPETEARTGEGEEREEERKGHGWKIKPIVQEHRRQPETGGDMDKIRRILDDLD